MEGAIMNATGNLTVLSEENLVDCDDTNYACNGGWMETAFEWIINNGGINTEDDYPYTYNYCLDPQPCRFDANKTTYTIQEFYEVLPYNETDLMEKIATVGPISVAIDASQTSFTYYSGGVYYEPNCSQDNLDHAVLAVGYGLASYVRFHDVEIPYYLVKNSWGPDWGDEGYIKMARLRDNNCGIATEACYPIA